MARPIFIMAAGTAAGAMATLTMAASAIMAAVSMAGVVGMAVEVAGMAANDARARHP